MTCSSALVCGISYTFLALNLIAFESFVVVAADSIFLQEKTTTIVNQNAIPS